LAEKIALNETNQYFISTHNPYFLLSLTEKTPLKDLNVIITYDEDYETKIKVLSEKEISEIIDMGIDIFFNIDAFIGKNK